MPRCEDIWDVSIQSERLRKESSLKCGCKSGCTYCHGTGVIKAPDQSWLQTVRDILEDSMILRKLLWLSHGVDHMLYGDDGEMQCNSCMIDFKRDSVRDIDKRFAALKMERLRKEIKDAKESIDNR